MTDVPEDERDLQSRNAATPSAASAHSTTTQSAVVAPGPPTPLGSGLETGNGPDTSAPGSVSEGPDDAVASASAVVADTPPNRTITIKIKNAPAPARTEPPSLPAPDEDTDVETLSTDDAQNGETRPEPDASSAIVGGIRRRLRPLSTIAYVVIGGALLAASWGIGFALYATTTVPYSAACVFRVSLPLAQQTGSDYFAASQYMAVSEIGYAKLDGVYHEAAGMPDADRSAVDNAVVIPPTAPNDFTTVLAKASKPTSASASANALCTSFVDHIRMQRKFLQDSEAADLRQRVTDLNTQASALGAAGAVAPLADQVRLESLLAAINKASGGLAATLSRQPDSIDVVALSAGGFRVDHRNLTATLFYGAGAAIVLTFLIVLLCEVGGTDRLSRMLQHRA